MDWLRNVKIRTKMLVSFALVIALIVLLVAIAATQMLSVRDRYAEVIEHPLMLRATLREIQSAYRDLRHTAASISSNIGRELAGREAAGLAELSSHAEEAYALTGELLDRANAIVLSNPHLDQAGRDVRLEGTAALRAALGEYHDAIVAPLLRTAGAHEYEESLSVIGRASALASDVARKIDAMLAFAAEAAANQTEQADRHARTTILVLIGISIVATLVSVAIAVAIAHSIGSPLIPLTRFMSNAATRGDFTLHPEWAGVIGKTARYRDELGQASAAASAFFQRVAVMGSVLENVANGDLTSDIPLLSERDSMGLALKKMQDNLNAVCGEIRSSSLQVATGANQVTVGAETLSTGASQQAASIEELSASIEEIAERTRHTADMASRAADLAGTIQGSAEAGRVRMEEMLAASREISEANESIRRIIKTIDEIAFQTNILAVNASVEAAHAGKYGRGFSVVAGSVRNLAVKSAAAAKDTERLIADSMEKAGLGVRLAEEASASFGEIAAGIDENSRLVSKIAKYAGDQSASIDQINTGIGQVSHVVRQNSVTAEESAAASEEMCGQSAMLQELIARFRLRESAPALEAKW